MAKPTAQEIRLGAIYRLGAKFALDRERVENLLVERLAMKAGAATQLAAHWFGTLQYRTLTKSV